ncbi:stress responsive A/B Barrel Domain protein [bacterium BMS3Bbin02]|nr:stress responsive A/B Barrel Domain protein [bacterium BMS3Bbin02]
MFRHVVMFWWKAGTTQAQIAAVTAGLASLPERIAQIQRYEHGPDVGVAGANADYVLVADFGNSDAWRAYSSHPAHVAVVEESVKPIVERIERIQYTIG